MPITGSGWELHIERLGLQHHQGVTRTYSRYQAHRDGVAIAGLFGHICECIGSGDNSAPNGKRIEAGRYPLSTQFGAHYRTIGFSGNTTPPAGHMPATMPGVLLTHTGNRSAILIHPGHPPHLYLSSIGCLNPTKPLAHNEGMDFLESRARVIALIDDLHQFSPGSFHNGQTMAIIDAAVVIDGEPMNDFPDAAQPAPLVV